MTQKPKLDLSDPHSTATLALARWLADNCPGAGTPQGVSVPECIPTARRILARAGWDESRAHAVARRFAGKETTE